jgi:hypothetical protein
MLLGKCLDAYKHAKIDTAHIYIQIHTVNDFFLRWQTFFLYIWAILRQNADLSSPILKMHRQNLGKFYG